MERKKMTSLLQEARGSFGSYDDFPTMPAGTDPMPCLSRNRVPQPFFLETETDEVIIVLAGRSKVRMPGAPVPEMELEIGDALYIPAGQPSRIEPVGETVQIRFKPEPPKNEAAVWLCERCGREVFRRVLDETKALPQAAWWGACQEFNSATRACPGCGTVHPAADLADIRWLDVAGELRRSDAEAAGEAPK
jgi:3-hydroxyanthranilate 3,4-dioxygenase